ncbi:TPA: GFA family protein [Pseudomonas aeruginosa]|nr:GFA family protein [Pseudomonas aeruginosa]
MPETHTGGCHCGYLRYAVAAPLDDVAHCHCSICRRTTGGIVTTWATVPRAAFRWLAGEPAEYASSANCTRYFCPRCGANLALFTRLSADTLDFTVASLDHPERAPPTGTSGSAAACHGYTSTRSCPKRTRSSSPERTTRERRPEVAPVGRITQSVIRRLRGAGRALGTMRPAGASLRAASARRPPCAARAGARRPP